jgi:parallel beta-helix repeat protein
MDCPAEGIVIGADGVTLDLNGHTIDGVSVAAGSNGSGVVVPSNVDDTTVTNGVIQQFESGVNYSPDAASNTTGHRVTRMRVQDTFAALVVRGVTRLVVADNALSRYASAAIAIEGLDEALIRRNRFEGPGPVFLSVFFTPRSNRNVISENTVTGGGGGSIPGEDNLVRRNFLTGVIGGFGAIGARNRIAHNEIAAALSSATGIATVGDGNQVTRNRVTGFSTGVQVEGDRPTVDGNTVSGSAVGIRLGQSTDALLSRNHIRGTVEDGIFALAEAGGAVLERNHVTSSRNDDGIDVEGTSVTLTRNRAVRNADLGIEAPDGVIDGGGNMARGNRNRLQCTGVNCR